MARPKRNDIATKEMHKAFTKLRRRRPNAGARDIERWAYKERGAIITNVTVQRVFNGEVDPTACGIELLLIVRDFYDAAPGELGEYAQERLNTIANFFGQRPDEGPTQAIHPSPWNDGHAVHTDATVLAFRTRRLA